MDTPEGSKPMVKEKKTRRRLRLSCVECTKRRQKCDRNHPCSLCITRGVAHLCRWENTPVARPTPARPPASALRDTSATVSLPDQSSLISQLRHRIASLETELENARTRSPSTFPSPTISLSNGSHTTSPTDAPSSSYSSDQGSLSPDVHLPAGPLHHEHPIPAAFGPFDFRLPDEGYQCSSTLAQLCLGHHGEFVGRGSVICALHSVSAKSTPRFLYAKSTESITEIELGHKFSGMPFADSIESLLPYVPSMLVVESLTSAFFNDVNWQYGIPEPWFRYSRAQMWSNLQPHNRLAGEAQTQINGNWLTLLFTILAAAPTTAYDDLSSHATLRSSDDYFMCAMMARRIVEDEYLNQPQSSIMVSVADGTVLSCLAAPILCDYLGQRGRISEAWKLAGNAIRNAEAVGMHRDPDWPLWQLMSADEKLLRRRAWWGLFTVDKAYAYILGRPQLLRREFYDVEYPAPYNPDGSPNRYNIGHNVLVNLMELLGDILDKCFGVDYPGCPVFLEMDDRLLRWEETLPLEYQFDYDFQQMQDLTHGNVKTYVRQNYTIRSWYLIGRLKLLIGSITGLGRSPQDPVFLKRGMERCISVALQTIRFQTAAYASLGPYDDRGGDLSPGNCWYFQGCFPLFEASVVLFTTMAQLPRQDKIVEVQRAVDSAIETFNAVVVRERGKTAGTAARALEVLSILRAQRSPETPSSLDSSV